MKLNFKKSVILELFHWIQNERTRNFTRISHILRLVLFNRIWKARTMRQSVKFYSSVFLILRFQPKKSWVGTCSLTPQQTTVRFGGAYRSIASYDIITMTPQASDLKAARDSNTFGQTRRRDCREGFIALIPVSGKQTELHIRVT